MYSIGQFSLITRLSVRTLRRYHENGLLVPDHVDADTGYRYYREAAVERARLIGALRDLDFSLKDVQSILANCAEDEDVLDHLLRRRDELEAQMRDLQRRRGGLAGAIEHVRRLQTIPSADAVELEDVPAVFFAGLRTTGRWDEIGASFAVVGRKAGRFIGGTAMSLCYDGEYVEDGADYEAGFPLRRAVEIAGLDCRELPSVRCVTLIHRGPYSELGRSYERVLEFINARNFHWLPPTRELYLKGPGMFFRGNPKKYVTEIQIPVQG